MESALTMDVLATDLADYLVRKGVCTDSIHLTSNNLTTQPNPTYY